MFWFTAAGVADHAAPLAIALGIVLAALLAVRMRFEEGLLRKTFPEYDAYARRTRRILPFVF